MTTKDSEFVNLDDMIAKIEAEPGGKERMEKAQQWAREALAKGEITVHDITIPQDDRPERWRLADCATVDCEFDPDCDEEGYDKPEDPEDPSWHFKRRCGQCGKVWFSLHCVHEQPNRPCGNCRS